MNKQQITTIALAIMAFFYYSIYLNYLELNYLGAPFFYINNDTFMDFFNTNWHSQRLGKAFTEWYSIYSPLNLYISAHMVGGSCEGLESSVQLRACDFDRYILISGVGYTLFIFLLFLIQLRERKLSLLMIIMPISFPILYAIERGNYIILAAIMTSVGLLINNKTLKNINYIIISNIKIYIFFPFILTLNGKYEIIKNIILFIIVIIFGAILYKDENWYYYFRNLFVFNGNIDYFQAYWMPTDLGVYKIFPKKSILNYLIHVISVIAKSYIVIKIYLIYFSKNKINYDKDILFCIFFLGMSQLINIGYYSYLILFPYFIKLDINNKISKYAFCAICYILIPFITVGIYYHGVISDVSFISKNSLYFTKDLFITINSILIPIMGFILFCTFCNQLNAKGANG
jgi:hypothetical protein